MLLDKQVKDILLRNHNLRRYKDDLTIKSNCLRIIDLFITYGFLNLDEHGQVIEVKMGKVEELSNFELLQLIESVIRSNDKVKFDNALAKLIQSIDYIGQCWFYPKEISKIIFEMTEVRVNFKRIKKVLNEFTTGGTCLKITNRKSQVMYRIRFTYQA